ncbi:glycosyltransferase [Primorskyibacter sp. 2E233]|uniref:glycosyltransferase n=1 Tax=Primorskyibacter sp. 2E233 TaxID=3413431 RepID=UPI003BF34254
MIFLTVGTQLAFPRLTEAMNRYAETTDEPIIAQVGTETTPLPNLTVRRMMDPLEFDETFARARVVVAHAGIGTILSAKRYRRPLIVVPRQHALEEHRNDHQLATARALVDVPGVHVAWETDELNALLQTPDLAAARMAMGPKHGALIDGLARFIQGARPAETPKTASGKGATRHNYAGIKGAS